jgi:hypothetical protein
MILTRLVLPVVLGLLFSASAEAQWVRTGRPVQRLDRWLGVGNGPGYHSCHPGSDPSWYNPWSALNSTRYSAPDRSEPEIWLNMQPAPGWQGDSSGSGWERAPEAGSLEPTPAVPRESSGHNDGHPVEGQPEQPGSDADQAAAARLLDRQYRDSGWAGR